jgi:hypothetical protein
MSVRGKKILFSLSWEVERIGEGMMISSRDKTTMNNAKKKRNDETNVETYLRLSEEEKDLEISKNILRLQNLLYYNTFHFMKQIGDAMQPIRNRASEKKARE